MKKVLAFVGIAVLMTSVAAADINPSAGKTLSQGSASGSRVNGALGSVTITAAQVGPLEVHLDASATTFGGDGVPVVVTFGGITYTLDNQVWLYGQIYDSPWAGGCTHWPTPGPNWCGYGEEYFLNSPNPLGSFDVSFTTTVPSAQNYQTFVIAIGGLTWHDTAFNWFYTTQSVAHSVVETIYIDSTQPPTPTPPPGGYGGEPIPTLNWLGVLAMIAILGGIAVLVMTRRYSIQSIRFT